jgi:hypothetical protein
MAPQAVFNPENVLSDAKRLFGHELSAPEVQNIVATLPSQLAAGKDGRVEYVLRGVPGKERATQEDVVAALMGALRAAAAKRLGYDETKLRDVVITHPVAFTAVQKGVLTDAAQAAGFTGTRRLLAEPVAAAMAHGAELAALSSTGEHIFLVFDWGGGTLDLTLVAYEGGIFEVKANLGDNALGGRDVDAALMAHCMNAFCNAHGAPAGELPADARRLQLLRAACEAAKRQLSEAREARVHVHGFAGGADLDMLVTRDLLEQLAAPLIKRAGALVDRLLADARMAAPAVGRVVLVGGASRMPAVCAMLAARFTKERVRRDANPETAVVRGAAVHAAIMTVAGSELVPAAGGGTPVRGPLPAAAVPAAATPALPVTPFSTPASAAAQHTTAPAPAAAAAAEDAASTDDPEVAAAEAQFEAAKRALQEAQAAAQRRAAEAARARAEEAALAAQRAAEAAAAQRAAETAVRELDALRSTLRHACDAAPDVAALRKRVRDLAGPDDPPTRPIAVMTWLELVGEAYNRGKRPKRNMQLAELQEMVRAARAGP